MESKISRKKILAITIIIGLIIGGSYYIFLLEDAEIIEENKYTTSPLLWRIDGENKSSYIFGSIHVGINEVLTLPDIVYDAIISSDVVYTEIKLDYETEREAISFSSFNSSEGKTLQNTLPEDLAIRLDTYLIGKNLSIAVFNQFKIWAIATGLQQIEFIDYYPYQSNGSLDKYIWNLALKNGIETNGLEKVSEQLGIFDNLSYDEQIQLLNDTLNGYITDLETIEKYVEELVSSYIKGNLDTLFESEYNNYDLTDPLYEKIWIQILHNRNINMSSRIINALQNNTDSQYFFTVGAAHLSEEDGLITLLENEGYTVTRVPFIGCSCSACDENEIQVGEYCYYQYIN